MSIRYDDNTKLLRDLKLLAAPMALLDAVETGNLDDGLSVELEVVYGHCWGAGQSATTGEVRIAPDRIGRRGN